MHSVVIVVMSFKNTDFGTNQKPVCTSYYRTILTYILGCIVFKWSRITGQIFAFNSGYLSLMHSFSIISANITIKHVAKNQIPLLTTSNLALFPSCCKLLVKCSVLQKGYLSLMHGFVVTYDYKIWHQETRNKALSYGVHIFWQPELFRRGLQCDRQTEWPEQ